MKIESLAYNKAVLLYERILNKKENLHNYCDMIDLKDSILTILFYKYLSDKSIQITKNVLHIENSDFNYRDEYEKNKEIVDEVILNELGCIVNPETSFYTMMGKIKNGYLPIEDLYNALEQIEDSAKGNDVYKNLLNTSLDLDSVKLGSNIDEKSTFVSVIIETVNDIYPYDNEEYFQMIASSFESFIRLNAVYAGKRGGDYTQECIQKLMCQLATLELSSAENVCDPTCGSASMLIRLGNYIPVNHFYGTELNSSTEKLARMNMIIHGIKFDKFNIRQGNTLKTPDLAEGERYQVVVANPPYSANWDTSNALSDSRFGKAGGIAPKTKADLAFVQHIVSHLSDEGKAAILLPLGVLFRSTSEAKIRMNLLRNNLIDAVIGLPEKMTYGTSIPVCCIVLKKNRREGEPICFIDASKYFTPEKNMNSISNDDINRILDAYKNKKNIDEYCYMASLDEIEQKNDFNLSVSRYVLQKTKEKRINIDTVNEEILKLNDSYEEVQKKIEQLLKEVSQTENTGLVKKAPLINLCEINKGSLIRRDKMNDGQYYVVNGSLGIIGYTDTYNTEGNSITVCLGRHPGFTMYHKDKFYNGEQNFSLTNIHDIHPKYLYYFLKRNEKKLESLSVGTAVRLLQRKTLEDFMIDIPNLEYQEKLVSLFDLLEQLSNIRNKLYEKTKELETGYMQLYLNN